MIFLWLGTFLLWLALSIDHREDMTVALWYGLAFLWILLIIHYFKSYRRWKKEDKLRRKDRLEQLESRHAVDTEE